MSSLPICSGQGHVFSANSPLVHCPEAYLVWVHEGRQPALSAFSMREQLQRQVTGKG